MTAPDPQALGTALTADTQSVAHRLAATQDADGIRLDEHTWCWVLAFIDLDYEYVWLVDVRWTDGEHTSTDYLAIFQGYDGQGHRAFVAEWRGQPVTFPKVPNMYDALAWWAEWVRDTRGGLHGVGESA